MDDGCWVVGRMVDGGDGCELGWGGQGEGWELNTRYGADWDRAVAKRLRDAFRCVPRAVGPPCVELQVRSFNSRRGTAN